MTGRGNSHVEASYGLVPSTDGGSGNYDHDKVGLREHVVSMKQS